MKTILLIWLCSLSCLCMASEYNINQVMNVLKVVESNNRIDAIGDNGKAYGILQIHKIAVDDINRLYGTTYTHRDAFDEVCSEEMFNLYISYGIRRYLRRYKCKPSTQDIVRMWNGGIYRGYRIKATLRYYRNYLKIKNNKL